MDTTVTILTDTEDGCLSGRGEVMSCWRNLNWTPLWHRSSKLKRKLTFVRDCNRKNIIKLFSNIISGPSVALSLHLFAINPFIKPFFRHPSVPPSIYSPLHLSIHPSIHQHIQPSNHLPHHPSIHSFSNPSTHPTTHPSNKPSIHPSIKNSIHASIQILLDTLLHGMFNLTQIYTALIS